jgi:hypothetical protein
MTANTWLAIVQTLLAIVFLFACGMKIFLRPEAVAMPIALPLPIVRALGVAEVFGAAGLIMPFSLDAGSHRERSSSKSRAFERLRVPLEAVCSTARRGFLTMNRLPS